MRKFVGNPIIKQDLESFEKIRDSAIAFCQYINAGGSVCDFTEKMINDVIDIVMKLKANRDFKYKYLGYDIPMYNDNGEKVKTALS